MADFAYIGGELELFSGAHRWKRYWISKLRQYITGNVLEIGAGIGSNTLFLRNGSESRWICLEPDAELADTLRERIADSPGCRDSEVRVGTIRSLLPNETFDTVLYIDVLEHIEDDTGELKAAAAHLNHGGRLVVMGPAHSWLFSEFDRAIGHYRRYTTRTLSKLTPEGTRLIRSFYLDSVGLLASAANRFALRQPLPKPEQLSFWDRFMIPISRVVDPVTGYRLGKSVVCVWDSS